MVYSWNYPLDGRKLLLSKATSLFSAGSFLNFRFMQIAFTSTPSNVGLFTHGILKQMTISKSGKEKSEVLTVINIRYEHANDMFVLLYLNTVGADAQICWEI